MADSPSNLQRHFLPWDRPLLPQAVEFLTQTWSHDGPLDLSDTVVVVPTRQSGRRLREALAIHAATFSAAVFPPRVMLPDLVVTEIAEATDSAPRLTSLLAWADVFRSVSLDLFRKVFPVDPPTRDFPWSLRLAQQFVRLQHQLAESGLRLADVVEKAGESFPESERWQQIAELERMHASRLKELGLRDRHAVRIQAAAQGETDKLMLAGSGGRSIRRIVLLAAPDPQPIALSVLSKLGRRIAIEVVIFAPADEQASFDIWGRPLEATWTNRILDLRDFSERVHLSADPAAQAARVAEVVQQYGAVDWVVSVGVADPDVLPVLESALQHAGCGVFNPEGRRRKGDALYQLVSVLAELAANQSFTTIESLARCPDFLVYLSGRVGSGFSAADFLRRLDHLHARHLPSTLAEARRHDPTEPSLAIIAEFRAALTSAPFPKNVAAALSEIFGDRRFDLGLPSDEARAESAGEWTEILGEIADAAEVFRDVKDGEWWEVALRLYAETIFYNEKSPGAVDLQGWLELLWEEASHLLVVGMNDGRVPEAVVGDPFLPESLRHQLGLKTNAARFARDAYLLEALARSRSHPGRLDLFLGKTSSAGDPLRPSRLLLQCSDSDLPERVRFLFQPAESSGSRPAWRRAWQLVPPAPSVPSRVAVTGVRAWLACPFRFYLERVLRMESVEPAKTELDVLDFGILCHAALEQMGRATELRNCTDDKVLRDYLFAALDSAARTRFGAELTLPLVVQLESARQRLSRAAQIQAITRAEGWVIERIEEKFELMVNGLLITGKIDRIDRHESSGSLRVLDYKTSDRPVEPWQAHVRSLRRGETRPSWARVIVNGREYGWSDLQLPLYRRAVVEGCIHNLPTGRSLVCAYFNLPKAASETDIRPWEEFSRELEEAARSCAEGVATAIREGTYWPPNETVRPEYDPFASLFHHGVADSVRWPDQNQAATGQAANSGTGP
ncbi:MAG: PD-(D/E)XK nuclease family protein [Opitutus sp.]